MMIFSDIVKMIATRATLEGVQSTENAQSVNTLIKQMFNLRYLDFQSRHKWPWKEGDFTIQTVPNYKTGSVTVTNGSRTVTNNGTGTFTTDMVDRVFKLDREIEMYEIADVPASSTFTLKEPYIGESGSSLSYIVWKRFYGLPPDAQLNADLKLWQYPYKSKGLPKSELADFLGRGYVNGHPNWWAWAKIDRRISTYIDGSLSGAKDSYIFTGNGTSWLGNIFPGTEIKVDSGTYNVYRVDSNTQFTSHQLIKTEISSGTKYAATTRNRPQIIFSHVPDPAINFQIDYLKTSYPLFNDNDVMNVFEGYEHIVIDATYAELIDKLTSDRAFLWKKIYEDSIREAWRIICSEDPIDQAPWGRDVDYRGYRPGLYGGR